MYSNNKRQSKSFPDPLAPQEIKAGKKYGLKYAKAIEGQWGRMQDNDSLFRKRNKVWDRNRDYAKGKQDTNINKRIITTVDTNNADGSNVNKDSNPAHMRPELSEGEEKKLMNTNP